MNKRSVKSGNPKGKLSSFTYYIPAPPSRKSGYREREFDKIMTGILQVGFEIVSLQTQAVGGSDNAGLFIMAVLRAPTAKIAGHDEALDIQDRFKLAHTHSSPDIIMDEDNEI
jgi:hypothetical protein